VYIYKITIVYYIYITDIACFVVQYVDRQLATSKKLVMTISITLVVVILNGLV
jgi:hypothetical protein